MRFLFVAGVALGAVLMHGSPVCAEGSIEGESEQDVYDDISFDEGPTVEEPWDPLEPMNRGIFWFNERLDRNIVEPVAKAYRKRIPHPIRHGVGNVFSNLRAPAEAASALVRFQVRDAVVHLGRFFLNSTLGIGGIADPASSLGLEPTEGDMGIAFAYHGIPAGPYLVLPLIGPSNVRDLAGRIADGAGDPTFWLGRALTSSEMMATDLSLMGTRAVHSRSELIDAIKAGRESSLDTYLFFQSSYYQHRASFLKPSEFDEME